MRSLRLLTPNDCCVCRAVHGVQGRLTDLFDSYGASQFLSDNLARGAAGALVDDRIWHALSGDIGAKGHVVLLFSLLIAVAALTWFRA